MSDPVSDPTPTTLPPAPVPGLWPATASAWAGAGVVPFGQPVLHTPTRPVDEITDDLARLAAYMLEVMEARDGIGLAANQVGATCRMFVHNLPRVVTPVIVNPVITGRSGRWERTEGCLSMTLEGAHASLVRARMITVTAQDLEGRRLTIVADELLARVFQHEIDHLDGVVYAQRLSGTERTRVYRLMAGAGVDTAALPPLDTPGPGA